MTGHTEMRGAKKTKDTNVLTYFDGACLWIVTGERAWKSWSYWMVPGTYHWDGLSDLNFSPHTKAPSQC